MFDGNEWLTNTHWLLNTMRGKLLDKVTFGPAIDMAIKSGRQFCNRYSNKNIFSDFQFPKVSSFIPSGIDGASEATPTGFSYIDFEGEKTTRLFKIGKSLLVIAEEYAKLIGTVFNALSMKCESDEPLILVPHSDPTWIAGLVMPMRQGRESLIKAIKELSA